MKAFKTQLIIEAESMEDAQSFLSEMIHSDPDQAIEHLVHQFKLVNEDIVPQDMPEQIPSAIMGDREFDYESNETGYDDEIKAWEEE